MASNGISFHECIVPPPEKARHAARGATRVRAFVGDVKDGQIRVLTSYDPTGEWDDGQPEHHVSVSVGHVGLAVSFRRPTDAEMEAVKTIWPEQRFAEMSTDHPHVRHIWEVE